jgi:hypothetical protein
MEIKHPSFVQAYQYAKISPAFKSDWECCLRIALQQRNMQIRASLGEDYPELDRLSHADSERVSWHCLASHGVHLLKTID